MRLPDLVSYQTAVQHPATAFADPDLRASTVTTNRLGLPRVATGNFAVTYQLVQSGRQWAVRCFHRDAADRPKRYAAISTTLASLKARPFVTIAYLPNGVRVQQNWYPVTKMPWLEGRPFNRAVEARLGNRAALADLERRFIALTLELRRLGLAHGDLQHGNILVHPSGELGLVDYDGMFVPALKGMPACESGDPNYQHPARKDQFDAELDRFATLLIVVALRALADAPDLWRTYNTDDNLLFRQSDLAAPDTSPLFRDLQAHASIRPLAERLARICRADYGQIPLLPDFLNPPKVHSVSRVSHANVKAVPPSPSGPELRLNDVVILNRIFSPPPVRKPTAKTSSRPGPRSWTVRRKVRQHALAFSPNGALLATAEGSGKIRVRDSATGHVCEVLGGAPDISLLVFSQDARHLVATTADGGVHTWSLSNSGRPTADSNATRAGQPRAVACTNKGPLVAIAHGSTVELCEPHSNWCSRVAGVRGGVRFLAVSRDARTLAACGGDGALRCWSVRSGALLAACRQHERVTAMALSSNGRVLASAAGGGIQVWDIPGGRLSVELKLPDRSTPPLTHLAFSADGARVVGADASGRIVIWHVATTNVEYDLASPQGPLSDLSLSPRGDMIAATTDEGVVWARQLEPLPPIETQWWRDVLRRVSGAALQTLERW